MTKKSLAIWPIKEIAISDLIPYSRNPRTIAPGKLEKLTNQIRRQGFRSPICLNSDKTVLAGHQRLKALANILPPETLIPCAVSPKKLSAAEIREIVATDNLSWGDWDWQMIEEDYDRQDLLDWGFDEADIKFKEVVGEVEGQDDAPEPTEFPICKPGDIWILGAHRLICGDATNTDDIQKVMGGGSADMLLTDPPYNVDYQGKTKKKLKIENDKKTNDAFREFLRDAFVGAATAMKPGAVFYIWHADSEGYNFRGACVDAGLTVRQCLIWQKNAMVMGRQDYHWKHEPCLYGWKDGAAHLWASDRKQTTILNFDRPQRNGEHPTMKPVALMEYQILNNTKGEDVVLDLFLGSGSTLIACEKLGRICKGLELDPRYCDVIIQRWQTFSKNSAILESSGKTYAQLAK